MQVYAIGIGGRSERRRVGRQAALCTGVTLMTWQQAWHLDREMSALFEEGGGDEEEESRRRRCAPSVR